MTVEAALADRVRGGGGRLRSMTRGVAETGSIETAALAIAIGVLANTALKTAVALVFGGARFRAIVAATLAVTMAAAAAAILALM